MKDFMTEPHDEILYKLSDQGLMALYLAVERKKGPDSELYYFLKNIPEDSYNYLLENWPENYHQYFTAQIRLQTKSLYYQKYLILGKVKVFINYILPNSS